jgi:ATP-dependent Clp protease protease subunit
MIQISNIAPVIVKELRPGVNSAVNSAEAALYDDAVIIFDTEVTRETAGLLQTLLQYLRKQGKKEITIYIDSPGGDVIEGLPMLDMMIKLQEEGIQINTIGRGMSASMGSLMLMCGSKGHRSISENGWVMVHDISSGFSGKFSDIKRSMQLTERLRKKLIEIISKRTGKTEAEVEKNFTEKGDNWLDSNEALAYGIVDNIIKVNYAI